MRKKITYKNIFDLTSEDVKNIHERCFKKVEKRYKFNGYDKPKIFFDMDFKEVPEIYLKCLHWDKKSGKGYYLIFKAGESLLSATTWKLVNEQYADSYNPNSLAEKLESSYGSNKILELIPGEKSSELISRGYKTIKYTKIEDLHLKCLA